MKLQSASLTALSLTIALALAACSPGKDAQIGRAHV